MVNRAGGKRPCCGCSVSGELHESVTHRLCGRMAPLKKPEPGGGGAVDRSCRKTRVDALTHENSGKPGLRSYLTCNIKAAILDGNPIAPAVPGIPAKKKVGCSRAVYWVNGYIKTIRSILRFVATHSSRCQFLPASLGRIACPSRTGAKVDIGVSEQPVPTPAER
jgi:hypothetical protein